MPAVVGVPVIAPVEALSVRPEGRVPLTIDQVTPETFALRVALYGVPAVPAASDVVVIRTCTG